ncbi:Transposase DDE domain-containing protein, partial [Streptomyces griseus]
LVITDAMWDRIEPLTPADPSVEGGGLTTARPWRPSRGSTARAHLAGPAPRVRCVPDRSQTPDQVAADGTWRRSSLPSSPRRTLLTRWDGRVGGLHCLSGSPARGRARKRGHSTRLSPRSRTRTLTGRLDTKVHLAADGHGRPLALHVTAARLRRAAFETVMARIRVPRAGLGRPRTRPDVVLADRAYSSRAIRRHLRRRAFRPSFRSPLTRSAPSSARPAASSAHFDTEAYKQTQHRRAVHQPHEAVRGLAMRTDKLAIAYEGALHLAAILIWTRPRKAEDDCSSGMTESGPGRGVDCLHSAVRATSEPLRDEQTPIDRHLAPRDATERRPIRQGVHQSRGTCLPACSEARRGKPERELEGSESVTKLRHGHHPRTWPDHREVKETGSR